MNGSGAEMVMTVDGTVELYESPDITTVEELVEFWGEDWGWIDCSDPTTLVVHDKGVPLHIKNTIERKRPSGITVEYVDESNDTSCTDSGHSDDQNHIESKSFHEQMCELADDLDEKRREREEQRVNEYLREQREVFKAEITEVRGREHSCVVTLDIPTDGEEKFTFRLPDSDGRSGQQLYEILGYLGATLRDMDMIEGMYLPVAHDSGSWEIRLPSDESGIGPLMKPEWKDEFPFARPSLPSVSQLWKCLWTNDDGVYISGPSLSLPSWIKQFYIGLLMFGGIVVGVSGAIIGNNIVAWIGVGMILLGMMIPQ